MEENLERVWKNFGKQTTAGKLLYDLYGVKYQPELHIKYPTLKMKKSETKISLTNQETARARSSAQLRLQNITYPDLRKKHESKYTKLDFIPKRKNESVIRQEMEKEKMIMIKNAQMKKNIYTSRKYEIEKLQNNFEFQERLVMPKGARLPGIKQEGQQKTNNTEEFDINKLEDQINIKNYKKILNKNEELNFLYNSIMKEIDERYAYMEEMKKYGKNVDDKIMIEIRERLDELKKLKKMINENE